MSKHDNAVHLSTSKILSNPGVPGMAVGGTGVFLAFLILRFIDLGSMPPFLLLAALSMMMIGLVAILFGAINFADDRRAARRSRIGSTTEPASSASSPDQAPASTSV